MGKIKSLSSNLKQRVKDQDMFGHTIAINFNKQGDTHVTCIVGTFSLIIKVFLLFFVSYKFSKMVTFDDDELNVEINSFDVDTMEEQSYKNSGVFIFHTIRKQEGTTPVWFEKDEVQRYLDVHYDQRYDDWYLPADQRYKFEHIGAKQCELSDFIRGYGDEALAQRKLDDWKGFSLICPDLSGDKDMKIKGNMHSMKASVAQMSVRKCNNTVRTA